MPRPEVAIHRVEPADVTANFTRELQAVALKGWSATTCRSEEELRVQFNPDSSSHVARVRSTYKQYADRDKGGLFIAETDRGTTIAGFILAAEDVSGSRLQRAYKRIVHPEKVYAHIRHIAVADPRQKIGGLLVSGALETFDREKVPTAYIFDENETAQKTFAGWGFTRDPADQEPKVIEDYFGETAGAVYQRRYTAESGAAVIAMIQAQQSLD